MKNGIMAWAHSAKRLCSKSMETIMEAFGLSYVEIGILLFLHENPQWDTSRDIADTLLLAKSNVSTAVENLVQRGYLQRQADPGDRRLVHLKLMAPAQILIERGMAEWQKLWEALFAGFLPEEMETLEQFGTRICDNVQKVLKQ